MRCGKWALMRRRMARGDTYRLRECGDGQRERRRFEREKPVVRIVWCMPERVVVWRVSSRPSDENWRGSDKSRARREMEWCGCSVGRICKLKGARMTDSHYSARHALIKPSLAPIGSFASLQYEVRPSFVHASGAFASEMTPSLASFNRSK